MERLCWSGLTLSDVVRLCSALRAYSHDGRSASFDYVDDIACGAHHSWQTSQSRHDGTPRLSANNSICRSARLWSRTKAPGEILSSTRAIIELRREPKRQVARQFAADLTLAGAKTNRNAHDPFRQRGYPPGSLLVPGSEFRIYPGLKRIEGGGSGRHLATNDDNRRSFNPKLVTSCAIDINVRTKPCSPSGHDALMKCG